eukprot:CAMPEP_0183364814 /NCGR_PEP_ID=MMETSP0164_2-20130417/82082_1 /TAXON_ID=221442 /ORGANISM="Coccolithus pelagicus ssp braarudi, Strain PLY182g" /LENGTH=32 /DNA_ID= /DNA_START= /DNA_END= /DNA_ORIENTATION=
MLPSRGPENALKTAARTAPFTRSNAYASLSYD